MRTLCFTFGLAASIAVLCGCDTDEQCVADCQSGDSTGSTTDDDTASPGSTGGTSSTSSNDSSSTDASTQICEDATADAVAFVEQNEACETVLDCALVDAICFAGAEACGSVGVSANTDLSQWNELTEAMNGACQCGADPCGASVMCNADARCEATWLSDDYCPSIAQDIETFLAANRSCKVDEDCTALNSSCHVDECSVVAVNVDTDPEDWATLDGLLGECEAENPDAYCNFVGECGPEIRCGDTGQCEAVF